MAVDLDEDLLAHVLDLGRGHERSDDVRDEPLVAHDEGAESLEVAREDARDEA